MASKKDNKVKPDKPKGDVIKPAKMGRPTKYTKALADKICKAIAESSYGLRKIMVKNTEFPDVATILRWLAEDDKKYFREQYARAREAQATMMAEEILEISDDGTNDYMTIEKGDKSYNVEDREVTNRSKLRVDARKWLASKLLPKKYGDKIDIDHTTGGDKMNNANPIQTVVIIENPNGNGTKDPKKRSKD
jgi:hypothetical protein